MRHSLRTLIVAALGLGVFAASRLRADEASDQFAVAAGHYKHERWKLAAAEFTTFLDAYPRHTKASQALFYCGEAWAQLGRYDQARTRFDQILTQDPEGRFSRQALFRRGEAALLDGDDRGARADLEKFHSQFPRDDFDAYVLPYLGQLELRAGHPDQAGELFADAIQRFPRGPLAPACQLGSAQALAAQSKDAQAVELLASLVKMDAAAGGDESPADDGVVAGGLATLVQCYSKLGRVADARTAYDRLVRLDPDSKLLPPALVRLAEATFEAGDYKQSTELFAAALERGGSDKQLSQALSGLAWSQFESGDIGQAAETFERLLKDHPTSPLASDAALARGEAIARLGESDAALAMYQLVVDRYADRPEVPEALWRAGRLHEKLKHSAQAAAIYEQLVEKHPQFDNRDAAIYRWAWLLHDSDQPDEAARLFARLRREYPQSRLAPDATYRLAEQALANKQFDDAETLLGELLRSKPPQRLVEHALYLQGRLAVARNRWDEVIEPLEKLSTGFPESHLAAAAEYWIAEAAYQQGSFRQAANQFERFRAQAKEQAQSWSPMVPLRLAQSLAQLNQWTEALAIAEHIADDFPDFDQQYEVDYLVGRGLASQADFSAARKAYAKVLHSEQGGKTETAAMAQWRIGESYFHQENYDAALREYLRVEILFDYPRWAAASLVQAAKCHEHLGEWKDAAALYTRVLKSYPDCELADEARERLETARTRTASKRKP